MLSFVCAILILSLTIVRDQRFYTDLGLMNSSQMSVVRWQNVKILMRELVSLANQEIDQYQGF
jgi:hypothetical protein